MVIHIILFKSDSLNVDVFKLPFSLDIAINYHITLKKTI